MSKTRKDNANVKDRRLQEKPKSKLKKRKESNHYVYDEEETLD